MPELIGEGTISTPDDEFGGALSPDGQTIVASTGQWNSALALYRRAGLDCPESHLGALAFPQTWLTGVLFIAGTRWTHLAVLGGAALVGALLVLWILPANGVHVLKQYQQDRIVGFMHRDHDPRGATYNVTQSINSVGAGGLGGRGVKGATQTNLNFLPEHATDFVFASISEQRGFVGVSILLLLYLLVVWRGLKVITGARDAFSAIAAGRIVVVSVGGSAMIANLLAIGILEAIHVRGGGAAGRRA